MAAKTKTLPKPAVQSDGSRLWEKIKHLVHEGNIRLLVVKDSKGEIVVQIPLTLVVIGSLIAPPIAVIGLLAALVTECSLSVQKK